jgi:MraZ protein
LQDKKGLKRIEANRELVSLRGAFLHKIGDQNRISLPSNFKEALINRKASRLVVVKYNDCLRAWPEDEWGKREAGLSSLNLDDDKVSEYLRYLYANCKDFELDSQGRIFLPEEWKTALQIKDQVFLVGMGNLLEVWEPEYYKFKQKELSDRFGVNRSYVAELLEKRKRDEDN